MCREKISQPYFPIPFGCSDADSPSRLWFRISAIWYLRIGSLTPDQTQLECWQSFWSNILPSSPFLYFVKLKLVFLPLFFLPGKFLYQKWTLISTLFCFHVGVARASQKHDCVRRSAANKETQVWSPANPRPAAAASLFPPLRGVIIALQIFAIAHHYSSQRTFKKVFKITEKAFGECLFMRLSCLLIVS